MTPHEFVAKWRGVELKERSASQSHFNDLCALLGVADPVTADPQGENPPLLMASDMDLIRVHANWTNTVQEVHAFRREVHALMRSLQA